MKDEYDLDFFVDDCWMARAEHRRRKMERRRAKWLLVTAAIALLGALALAQIAIHAGEWFR